MWNKPHLLNAIADLLMLVAGAAVLAAAAVWLVRVPSLPVRHVVFTEALPHTKRGEVEQVLPAALKGNFFSLNLDMVRGALEKLPWVRHADVRRLWPGRLMVHLEEHRAAAAWNDRALLDIHGAVFEGVAWRGMPHFYAPDGMEREVARRYGEFARIIDPLGMRVEQLVVSARQSWRVRLTGGISVELGREKLNERLARFARFYPKALAAVGSIPRVDMRYPNGFAGEVHPKAGEKVEAKRAKQA